MKNLLLGLLINVLYAYVVFPVYFVGVMAWIWVPIFFETSFASIIGVVITILTLVVTGIVKYKLESY